jgi:coenzyme F420-reducing hydrogenase beta subunit
MYNDQDGFVYPRIIDEKKCKNCGLCLKHCTVNNRNYSVAIRYETAKYAYNASVEEIKKSSSGGIAAGLYNIFLKKGCMVAGVRYSSDFRSASFELTNDKYIVEGFKGSKYIKAKENGVLEKTKEALHNKATILFIGLPCEIAALKNYLENDYINLYTCELICHGPTSEYALSDYVKQLEIKYHSKVIRFTLRGKKPYWKPYYIIADFENGLSFSQTFLSTSFNTAFQVMKRPSCNICHFKDGRSCSDLIIGDFHAAKKGTAEYNPFGVSICFPITSKGEYLLELLRNESFVIKNADKNRALGNRALIKSIPAYKCRSRFIRKLKENGLDIASNDRIVRLEISGKLYWNKIYNRFKYIFR